MPRVVQPEAGEQLVPIRLWGRVVPTGALDQLKRVAAQPYVVEHVAAMQAICKEIGVENVRVQALTASSD